jgi:transposase
MKGAPIRKIIRRYWLMTKDNRIIVGMDVHKDTIAVAVLPPGSDRVTEARTIGNDSGSIRGLVDRLSKAGSLAFVYEAGPCGYEVHRQITGMGQACEVIAPALTPVRPGDRVKTDRRDAEKLARFHRAGELTPIRVPTREEEAARDLVRIREDSLSDRLRARHRLGKFLLRQGRVYRETKSWGVAHRKWYKAQRFEFEPLQRTFEGYVRALEEAEARLEVLDRQVRDVAEREPYLTTVKCLRCLKGIDTLGAITLSVEAQEFRRFGTARAFMSYTGAVPSEFSSGGKERRGSITKAGNAHLRRILVEAAWSYRHRNTEGRALAERRKGCPPDVVRIARKAQDRLTRQFARMVGRGKPSQIAAVAVARELSGFVWSIAQHLPEVKTA